MKRHPQRSRATIVLPIVALCFGGCSGWFLSGNPYPGRTRPVARIETRGGVEYGATTEFGVLFLGRTATEGPCRVHYFLGDQLIVDDGRIDPFGGPFRLANIDTKHNSVKLWTEPVRPSDPLVAMVIEGGTTTAIPVQLANREGVSGNVLAPLDRTLPAGTPLFVSQGDGERYFFVGLVTAEATLERAGGPNERFALFAGLDAMRAALEVPENELAPVRIKYRADGLWLEQQDRRGALAPRTEDELDGNR